MMSQSTIVSMAPWSETRKWAKKQKQNKQKPVFFLVQTIQVVYSPILVIENLLLQLADNLALTSGRTTNMWEPKR